MQRLLEICATGAVLYLFYALTMKNWTYESEALRLKRRERCKRLGMSNVFYFIAAPTLFLLNLFSGGMFVFYWNYQQWSAVRGGFKRLDKRPLSFGPLWRTVFLGIYLFSLNAIINRTCIYLRKPGTFPAWFWGCVWLICMLGLAAAPIRFKPFFYVVFCAVPALLQRRLNALPSTPVNARPKPKELAVAVGGLLLALAAAAGLRAIQAF